MTTNRPLRPRLSDSPSRIRELNLSSYTDYLAKAGLATYRQMVAVCAKHLQERGKQIQTPRELVDALLRAERITPWQHEALVTERRREFVIGPYLLLGSIENSGLSRIYLAEHKTTHRKVVLSVLRQSYVGHGSFPERFHQQARLATLAAHPHVAKVYETGVVREAGQPEWHYAAAEYMAGPNLYDLVAQYGPLSAPRAAEYIRQAALGLSHLHAAGIVHRNIKPRSLELTDADGAGSVKVTNLSVVRQMSDPDAKSLTLNCDENVVGTVDFLSPEQVLDSHKADARSDLYGLGCSLFYLLTARPPFSTGSAVERMLAHLNAPAPAVDTARNDIPHEIVALCSRLLAKKPADRLQSATELAEALQPFAKLPYSNLVNVAESITAGGSAKDSGIDEDSFDEELDFTVSDALFDRLVGGSSIGSKPNVLDLDFNMPVDASSSSSSIHL